MRILGTIANEFEARIAARQIRIGVLGLGYVGLPLGVEFAHAGFPVCGIDVDPARVSGVNAGRSHISDIPGEAVRELVESGRLHATDDYTALGGLDAAIICVQTPFTPTKEPDLRFVVRALEEIAARLRPGQLIILQSTTYPGTTEEVALPILSRPGLRVGEDFFLAFSPERVEPGNTRFTTRTIPKVVGGITPACAHLAARLFAQIIEQVHTVTSTRVAEMTKLLENVFRSVNIALVNELAILCQRMGIDVWEVINAAATKPFGYMPFYPGPGVGGHCIPVDPYYLAWKARAFDFNTKFVALAAEINENMPYHVAGRVMEAINLHARRSVADAAVLAVGVSYKRDVGDIRESPAVKVLEALAGRGARVAYHDPFVPEITLGGETLRSRELTPPALAAADCVVVLTDHSTVDYQKVVDHARLVFDVRNATRRTRPGPATVLYL